MTTATASLPSGTTERTKTVNFTYDADGKRTGKTTVSYYLNGNTILAMKKNGTLAHFVYDQDGQLLLMKTGGKN